MRFAIKTSPERTGWDGLLAMWRLADEIEVFESGWVFDHFEPIYGDRSQPCLEGWTSIAALAQATERLRVGVLVTGTPYRHPAVLANMAATVDAISNGRLELGLGAGWFVPEHERFGLPFPPPGERVGRFREAVEIVDSLLRHEATTFEGRYYRLTEASVRPAPLQKPRPPLTLGAHRPRMLRICAEYADSWNSFGTVEEMRERNELLDQACAAVGREPREIRRSFYGWASQMEAQGLPDPWQSTAAFEDVVGRYLAVGIEEFVIDQPRPEQFGVLEQVVTDVLPPLRRAMEAES
jgi:F420-dependent oxidoreductase-like protein